MESKSDQEIKPIVEAISNVVGYSSKDQPIVLHEPDFNGTNAWPYVKQCLDTGWVSSAGSWVNQFEMQLRKYTGAKHVVAVNNGTVGLRMGLHLVGVKENEEVLVPPLTFVGTANAISHLGAIPHFVDIEKDTLGLCPNALEKRLNEIAEKRGEKLINRLTGRRIAAVMPVHVFGNPADVVNLKLIADKWGLPMIEDAAEALGSWRRNTHCGLIGSIGVLSFNGNKLITTGGGGAILTNDDELAQKAKHLSTTAKQAHPWAFVHDSVGWNDRLPNINAALGVAQLEDLESRLSAKRQLALEYSRVFSELKTIELIEEPEDCQSNHWLISVRFITTDSLAAEAERLEVLKYAHSVGILLRPVWMPLHQLPMYKNCPAGSLKETEYQALRLLNMPSSPQLMKKIKL